MITDVLYYYIVFNGGINMKKEKFNKVSYNNQFNLKTYDRINLVVPKGKKDIIKTYAEANGESVNAFINRAINEAMNTEEG